MSAQSVLLPVFVHVLMVYGVLGGLVLARQIAQRRLRPDPAEVAAGRVAWDGRSRQIGASYANQFELPVLFFALVAFALITKKADGVFVVLEWLFVAARVAHAAIHVTTNALPLRGLAFAASAVILGIAWILFAAAIIAA